MITQPNDNNYMPGTTPVLDQIFTPEGQTYKSVTDRILGVITTNEISIRWLMALGFALGGMQLLALGLLVLIWWGPGVWGINQPVGWGFAIINFVWWIGIGHAGTFISAILLLAKQRWRNSINRFAEAMTLFAVANAGIFPLVHVGRIHRAYYLFPLPTAEGVWPQWRSPLIWDVVAVSTYGTVSLLFWYVGLVPDLASLRDRIKTPIVKFVAGLFSLGWRGESRQWQRHQTLYTIFAGLSTPLVLSVHSIVSFDFAVGLVPGWHSTIFPPYFVAGAVFAGFAMVATIVIPVRVIYKMKDMITDKHLDNMGKVILVTGLFVSYGYLLETWAGYFTGDRYEIDMTNYRMWKGPYWYAFWGTIVCNVLAPQLLWSKAIRTNPFLLFIVCQFVNVGMWYERFMIVVGSLSRDFMTSAWGDFHPTRWDWCLYIGTIFFFTTLVLLFVRFLPMISVFEMRELLHLRHSPDVETKGTKHIEPKHAEIRLSDAELYGVVAEFDSSYALEDAAAHVSGKGYKKINAYSPLPLENLPDAMRLGRPIIPGIMLVVGILGGLSAFAFQSWTNLVSYPQNVGGRPLYSWPSFIPITFEITILSAAFAGLVTLIIQCQFPELWHPISNTPGFERASSDRYFLAIEKKDAKFDRAETKALLESLHPIRVSEVSV